MAENGVAKALRVIGAAEAICGIILGIVVLAKGDDFAWIGIGVMLTSSITCIIFVGFAEIIKLLQKNADNQDAILIFLKGKPVKDRPESMSVIQDIESNLPEM